jgi:hypothetical protein
VKVAVAILVSRHGRFSKLEHKNSGQEKSWSTSDQTFQADFNEFLFILVALKQIEILGNSHPHHMARRQRNSFRDRCLPLLLRRPRPSYGIDGFFNFVVFVV